MIYMMYMIYIMYIMYIDICKITIIRLQTVKQTSSAAFAKNIK